MSEKLSERTIAEEIVNRWIAAFRDDLSGKNARERLVDLIHAALEQQLAAKDAEIARLREDVSEKLQRLSLGRYDARNFRHEEQVISAQALDDVITALAETSAAPSANRPVMATRNAVTAIDAHDDKSEIWRVTDGDEQQKWHCYEVSPGHWMCDLLETTPAAPALCGQAERDARLIELTTDNSLIYYGPYPCPACRRTICRVAKEQGVEAFDYPVGPIYPNTNWTIHDCQRVPAAPKEPR